MTTRRRDAASRPGLLARPEGALSAAAFVPAFVHHHLGPILGGVLLLVVFGYGVVIARQEEEARRRRRAGIGGPDGGYIPGEQRFGRQSRRRGRAVETSVDWAPSSRLEEMLERQTAILARLEQLVERSMSGQTAPVRPPKNDAASQELSPVYRAGEAPGAPAIGATAGSHIPGDGPSRPNGSPEREGSHTPFVAAHPNGIAGPPMGPDPAGLMRSPAAVTWTTAAVQDMKRLPVRTAAMIVDGVERRVRTLSPGLTATVLLTVRGHTVFIDAGPQGFQVERIDV